MKEIFLLVAVILGNCLTSNSQSRFPIKSNSAWRINNEVCCNPDSSAYQEGSERFRYFVNSDTLIGSTNYFKLYKTGIIYLNEPVKIENKYIGAIRDEDNKFYFIANNKDSEELLYNFDLKVGDYVGDFQVSSIDTLNDGRKRFLIDAISVHCGSANTIIEGIGWLGGLLEGNACYGHPGVKGTYLVCYSEGGETKYVNPLVDGQCDELSGYNPPTYYNDVKITLANDNLIVESSVNIENGNLIVYNILGKPVMSGRVIDTKSDKFKIGNIPSGVYIAKFECKDRSWSFKFSK